MSFTIRERVGVGLLAYTLGIWKCSREVKIIFNFRRNLRETGSHETQSQKIKIIKIKTECLGNLNSGPLKLQELQSPQQQIGKTNLTQELQSDLQDAFCPPLACLAQLSPELLRGDGHDLQ